jgi:hypothetical protein
MDGVKGPEWRRGDIVQSCALFVIHGEVLHGQAAQCICEEDAKSVARR